MHLLPHPINPVLWLMLAGLASRYQLTGIDIKEVVMMSYYTGPSKWN